MFQLSWRETLTLTMLTPTGILNRLYSLDQDGLAYAYLIMILLQVTVEHAHHAVAVFIANLHSPFSNSTATSSLIRVCLIGTASPGNSGCRLRALESICTTCTALLSIRPVSFASLWLISLPHIPLHPIFTHHRLSKSVTRHWHTAIRVSHCCILLRLTLWDSLDSHNYPGDLFSATDSLSSLIRRWSDRPAHFLSRLAHLHLHTSHLEAGVSACL